MEPVFVTETTATRHAISLASRGRHELRGRADLRRCAVGCHVYTDHRAGDRAALRRGAGRPRQAARGPHAGAPRTAEAERKAGPTDPARATVLSERRRRRERRLAVGGVRRLRPPAARDRRTGRRAAPHLVLRRPARDDARAGMGRRAHGLGADRRPRRVAASRHISRRLRQRVVRRQVDVAARRPAIHGARARVRRKRDEPGDHRRLSLRERRALFPSRCAK